MFFTFLSDTLAIPKQNICTHEIDQRIPVMFEDDLRWPTMGKVYLEVLRPIHTMRFVVTTCDIQLISFFTLNQKDNSLLFSKISIL